MFVQFGFGVENEKLFGPHSSYDLVFVECLTKVSVVEMPRNMFVFFVNVNVNVNANINGTGTGM